MHAALTGKDISLSAYKHDNPLIHILPITGKILRYVMLSADNDWLLVKLHKSFTYNGLNIDYVLIKRPIRRDIELKKPNQLVALKLVPDVTQLDVHQQADFYPLEFWALCR